MTPRSLSSSASIAPVGLEVEVDPNEGILEPPREEAQQTGPFRIPMQRRRLGGVVAGTVAGCALILVAAVIARGSQASKAPATASAVKSPPAAAVVQEGSWGQRPQAPGPGATLAALSPTVGGIIPSEPALTGTVRLHRPAWAGHVWIDGKKLTSTSALVGCGIHQVKVGAHARPRSVDVPCGGEIVISK